MQEKVLFELEGKPVHPGDRLYVDPGYVNQGGTEVEAYGEASNGHAVFRAVPSGAVPTLPISAVSWTPHPDGLDIDAMRRQGITRPSFRDITVWRLGRKNGLGKAAKATSAGTGAWISVRERPPCHGQNIVGAEFIDGQVESTWCESWDKDEPIGLMTHWIPMPALIAEDSQVELA